MLWIGRRGALQSANSLEIEEGGAVRTHLYVVICAGVVNGTSPAWPSKESPSFALQRFHAECLLRQVLVGVPATLLACRVRGDPKGSTQLSVAQSEGSLVPSITLSATLSAT